jgi:hypothetical protein
MLKWLNLAPFMGVLTYSLLTYSPLSQFFQARSLSGLATRHRDIEYWFETWSRILDPTKYDVHSDEGIFSGYSFP